MLDFTKSPALSPSELAQRIRKEKGIDIHDNTCRDWMKIGVRGRLLKSRVIGNRYFTTWEAYLEFDSALNGGTRE